MDRKIVKSYIEEYKRNFNQVHDKEIYKWKAIKQFQDNFDINSTDFYSNLDTSLSKAANLLDSGQYFPKRMLLKNVQKSPEQLREMFKILYDEDQDVLERIENFRSDFKLLSKKNFPKLKNDYQDDRALIVYLALNYPERYFFYKFRMFKDFAKKIEFAYKPIRGKIENIGQYQSLCELVRYEIENDQELLNLHENRLDGQCYRDKNYNVLTQDFIYAVVKYLDITVSEPNPELETRVVSDTQSSDLEIKTDVVDFTPKIINHIQNNIENKRLGDLGEIWVLKQEIDYLIKNGKQKLAKKVKHIAKDKGDGSGFDILSYDLNGDTKYIEVKTTRGSLHSTFFVTRNELERSKKENENYYLYRVYEFDEDKNKANLLKIQGELTTICKVPMSFKVNLKQ